MKHLSFGRTSAKPKAMIEREEKKEEKIVISPLGRTPCIAPKTTLKDVVWL
jgi:hypothetical protein